MNVPMVPIQEPDRLNWWKDYWSFQPVVFKAMTRAPFVLTYFVISAVVSAITDQFDKFLRIPDGIMMLAMSMVVIFEVWSRLTGQDRQDHKGDYKSLVSAWGNSILYSIALILGGIVFLLPGIYFLFAASLGLVFVCIEQMRAAPAFNASRQLIKGRFFQSLGYLFGMPFCLGLLIIGTYLTPIILSDENFDKTVACKVMTFFFILIAQWLVISIVPLQVRLYLFLKMRSPEGLMSVNQQR